MNSRFPIIGGMATMPSRIESLRLALPRILNQVDKLYLYFDQYKNVPNEFLIHPKIIALPTDGDEPDLGCSGKFSGLKSITEPSIYFTFDDDILYPENYVRHLLIALKRHQFKAIIGVHGSIYQYKTPSYYSNRLVFNFPNALEFDVLVDELGTGTIAFLSSLIEINPNSWKHRNMSDLMLMLTAVENNIQRIAIRREKNFLRAIDLNQLDSIHRATAINDVVQTALINDAMTKYPDFWAMSS